MRWQRLARLAIAIFVLGFAAVVFVTIRRDERPKVPATTPRRNADTTVEIGAFEHSRYTPEGKLNFHVRGEGQETYADGRTIAKKAVITLPDRNGRNFTIAAGLMEMKPPEKPGASEISVGRMWEGVKLNASDGLEITSAEATYDDKTGVVSVPGAVQFTRDRMTGSGVGATYDRNREVIWLLAQAKVVVKPDEKGAGALEATSSSAGLARADHYIRLTGNAHVVGDGRTIDAGELTVQLSPDDRLIQTMALRGNSSITGTPGPNGAQGMSARDIDLVYAPDGRTLQQAKLMENAVAQLAAQSGGAAKRVSAKTIDMAMGADGSTVTSLVANQAVQVDLPASGDAPARQINAVSLNAGGPNGLQTATFTGGVTYREVRAGQKGAAPSERTGRSLRLIVETQPGFGDIQQADFRGNVYIADGGTTVEGSRALYKVASDSFDIGPSPGDPGPPPSVNDGRVLVNARTITFAVTTRKLRADTSVRSSMQSAPGRGGKPGDKPQPGRGGPPANGQNTKLPSMLKQDAPVNVTSNTLDYDGDAGTATYSGDARLFQERTSIKADTIILDNRTANLDARGHVSSVMWFEEVDSKTKTRKLVESDATGDSLLYEDGKRLATYRTGPTAKAHIIGTQGDLTADVIQLFLKDGANELERAEADGSVTVKEGTRTAVGVHLTYTAADETYVMSGAPVEIEDRKPNDCSLTVGSQVTFRRSNVDTKITGNGFSPATMKPCRTK